jgi:aminoglycoside phosphotransferase (APT) family kinase protein
VRNLPHKFVAARPESPMNATLHPPPTDLARLLFSDGVILDPAATMVPLSGGVSSEIYLVNDGGRQFVVKRALRQLKVEQEWFADIGRNAHEAAYLGYVARFAPDNVPQLQHVSAEHGYFTMEYLGAEWQNWKTALLDGRSEPRIAQAVSSLLGKIHAHSAADPEARERFRTLANFEQLRIEPYLLATARRHPRLQALLEAEAARLRAQRSVLTHGDFSPKNILVSPRRVVVVDCECAWYGDAAFDVAFLLNHVFLKSAARPATGIWRPMVESIWSSYLAARFAAAADAGISALERDVSVLLPMLMLARVDGKSPVEYLSESQRNRVRRFAVSRIEDKSVSLREIVQEWFT